ncbi:ANTAR domain-containing protein [Streptomyces sp. NBC_00631]|uniref:ANTAR domain-containing protein n=1 Tax=Streptomyces sp. NBC_00631 TaxID=2975793 RepID=UPI0030E0CEAA
MAISGVDSARAAAPICAMGRLPVEEAWRALRDVSQRTNTRLRTVAEHILTFAQGGDLPQDELGEFHQAIRRYTARTDAAAALPPRRD